MRRNAVSVVGAAETTQLGVIPNMSQIQLHADAALNAMADCGLRPKDIDGIATANETPVQLAHYLGITPTWVDGTSVGGCSFMLHVRHAAAAIEAGLAKTILITHGESGKSRIGNPPRSVPPSSLAGQFEQPFGPMGPPSMFTIPVMRYMKTYGVTEEQIAQVSVVQREWAAMHPRATFRTPITTEDVLNSRMIAWPFRLLMCCLVTDGGGAFVLVRADRARELAKTPVYVLGSGTAIWHRQVSSMADLTVTAATESGRAAYEMAGMTAKQIDVVQLYDAFTINTLLFLEDLGFCAKGEAGAFVEGGGIAPGGRLPVNTNGGGLSCTHPGMYGVFAVIEAVRQLRGECGQRQVPGSYTAIAHGNGGTLSSQSTVIFGTGDTL